MKSTMSQSSASLFSDRQMFITKTKKVYFQSGNKRFIYARHIFCRFHANYGRVLQHLDKKCRNPRHPLSIYNSNDSPNSQGSFSPWWIKESKPNHALSSCCTITLSNELNDTAPDPVELQTDRNFATLWLIRILAATPSHLPRFISRPPFLLC